MDFIYLHGVECVFQDAYTICLGFVIHSGCPFSLQVSTPEMDLAEKWNHESQAFWEKTQQLLSDLQSLQQETQDIACPCKNPKCPFRAKKPTDIISNDYITSTLQELNSRRRLSGGFSNISGRSESSKVIPFHYRSTDCEIAIEEEPDSDDSYEFKRNAPSRMAQRRVMQSRSRTGSWDKKNRLSLPSPSLLTPSCRSISLPSPGPNFSFDTPLGYPQHDSFMYFQYRRSSSVGRISASV